MKSRILAALGFAVLAAALTVHAQPPMPPDKPAADKEGATPENLTRLTDRAATDYKKFEDALLRLAQRMRKSPRIEEQQKAETLEKAIKIANEEQVENRFSKLVTTLVGNKDLTTTELEKAAGQNEELIKILRDMLSLLLTDSELLKKREEIKRLSELIKQIEGVIKAEKIAQTKMDGKRVASDAIAKDQKDITKTTESIARSMPGGKPNEAKPNDGKPNDGKPNDGKPNDGKPSDGKPNDGKPSDGKPSDGKPQQGNNTQQQSPPSPQDVKAQKQIQDAIAGQKQVEDELKKDNRPKASDKTGEVIDKLQKLKEELEKRLRQLREEELERLLANLQARCERMLAMQIAVQSGTRQVFTLIAALPDRKASRAEEQQAQQLSTREGDIVKEANRTLQLMSAEGSAVAFAMSLENVRDDMVMIEKRLDKYDVGEFTQKMEQDVIDALKEMIEALKKKQQEMKDAKNNPPPPGGQPPPQRLLDLLAELKLIRSQQVQVNKRTIDYARHYQGEQTDDPLLQKELETLAKRQAKLEDMLKKIATGKNQ